MVAWVKGIKREEGGGGEGEREKKDKKPKGLSFYIRMGSTG